MRAWQVTRFGADLGGIELHDAPDSGEPGPGEVVIDVGAVGISISDLLLATGGMPGMERTLPQPIGIEYAGTVRARGPDVTEVDVGDRVCGMGSASERLLVPARDVARLPDALSLEEGAAVPVAYMTAHVVLHRQGRIRAGDRVLVLAAASGTGLALVQLARAAGAEVHGVASDSSKLDAVRAAGAVAAYVGWERELPKMDMVVDTVGGESFRRSFDLLGPGGTLVILDATSRHPGPGETEYRREPGDVRFDPLTDLMFNAKSVTGIFVPLLWPRDGGPGPLLAEALHHLRDGAIRPAIARTFTFEEAVDALRYLQERRNVGRVILAR